MGLLLASGAFTGLAQAEEEGVGPAADSDVWDGDYDIEYQRRSDFMLTLTGSGVLGAVSGYRNEVDEIDVPAYEASTGLAVGGGATLMIGLAFRDWMSLGVGYSQSVLSGGGHEGRAWAALLRVEAYPWFGSGFGDDFGLAAQGGIGQLKLEKDGRNTADGGAVSVMGLGAFWEGLRAGQLSFGPALDYSHVYSRSITAHLVTLGLRGSFYGGP
ncbi:MAG: hypothetical protein KF915_09495 [Polyangiaceae bacterium]|nr:hypothetical protein [Polyangiaceae bacterium]